MRQPVPGEDALMTLIYRGLGAAFAVVGLTFLLVPDGTVDALNAMGSAFGAPPAPHPAHRFWLSLGSAYMAVVTVLAFQIAAAPRARRLLMLPLATGKAVSSGTCLMFWLATEPYFIYVANFLVDGGIVLIVCWTYRRTAGGAAAATVLPPASSSAATSSCTTSIWAAIPVPCCPRNCWRCGTCC